MKEWLKKNWPWVLVGAAVIVAIIYYLRSAGGGGGGGSSTTVAAAGPSPDAVLQYESQMAAAQTAAQTQENQIAGNVAVALIGASAAELGSYYNAVTQQSQYYYQSQTAQTQATETTKQVEAAAGAQVAQAQATAQAQASAAASAASAQTNHDLFSFAAGLIPFLFCDHERTGDASAYYGPTQGFVTYPTSMPTPAGGGIATAITVAAPQAEGVLSRLFGLRKRAVPQVATPAGPPIFAGGYA